MFLRALLVALAAAAAVNGSILTPTRGPLPWNDWNFIATTDIHGFVTGQGGNSQGQYSANMADFAVFVDEMKALADSKGVELFVVDSGDHHDGTALSDDLLAQPVDGYLTEPVVAQVAYDVLSIGNHEMYLNPIIDYTAQNVSVLWGPKYLTSNTYLSTNGTQAGVVEPIGQKFIKFVGSKGTKVTAFGWLYQSFQGSQGTHGFVNKVTSEVTQKWFTDAIADAPDFFLLVGHITLRYSGGSLQPEWTAMINAIRAVHVSTPIIIFGGHYHIRDYMTIGPNVYALAAGRYMETIGFLSLNKTANTTIDRRYLDANVPTYNFHLGRQEDLPLGNSTAKGRRILEMIQTAAVDTNASQIIGSVPQDYYLSRVPWNSPSSIFNVTAELMQGAWQLPSPANPALFVINAGSLRLDLFAGPLTSNAAFEASPFSDYLYVIRDLPFSVIANFSADFEYFEANSLYKKFGKRDSATCNYTIGYVTVDDLSTAGNPGDDTAHCAPSNNNNPNYGVYSPAAFPAGIPADQKWDLVHYDFISKDVVGCLAWKHGLNVTVETQYNPDKAIKASDLFPMMAAKFWNNVPTATSVTPISPTTSSLTATAAAKTVTSTNEVTSLPTEPAGVPISSGYTAPNIYSSNAVTVSVSAAFAAMAVMVM
ncbi:hypothetical protein HDU83_009138 [Entophlyctis luteolus]|nr:hypothetical protein HDU83_009138 [Entophlyctis luteolus]